MKHLYLISGLGADERTFKNLDLSGFQVTHVVWETPIANETVSAYARRLLKQIHTTRPVIIGLSFGGIVAIEIAKLIPVECVILIASVKCRSEIPFYFRWAGKLRLHKFFPLGLLKRPGFINDFLFGVTGKEDRRLLASILKNTDDRFLGWAIGVILNWDNRDRLPGVFHLHGSADRILPRVFVRPDLVIAGGGHMMVLNKAREVSAAINKRVG